jgi:hypothetical protein
MHGKAAASLVAALRGRARTPPVVYFGVAAETWSSAERFRGVRTGGARQTQRDFVNRTLDEPAGYGPVHGL